ncbi:hypothetical protein PIB30_112037, partial [Stylosanthes scabra]|nr:hypothetical protein [Stylosanthes scabra]
LSFVIYLKESNRILFDPHFLVGTISTHRVILLDPVHLPESLLCLRKRKRKVFERSKIFYLIPNAIVTSKSSIYFKIDHLLIIEL